MSVCKNDSTIVSIFLVGAARLLRLLQLKVTHTFHLRWIKYVVLPLLVPPDFIQTYNGQSCARGQTLSLWRCVHYEQREVREAVAGSYVP